MSETLWVDEAFRCENCDHSWYYTNPHCPNCSGENIATYSLNTGELLSSTTVYTTPDDVRTPNRLGLVRFDDEVQLIAQIEGNDCEIGEIVKFAGEHVLRGDSESVVYGPRLVPVDNSRD